MTKTRVLIAEDSIAMQAALSSLLGEDARIEIVGVASDGAQAIELACALRPDVITMDILMPELDGVAAIERIMASAPSRILVVSSIVDDRQIDLTFQAMRAGALEAIGKPSSARPEALRMWGARVREAILLMAEVPVITRRLRRATTHSGHRIDAWGIVASTGGPAALSVMLAALPHELPVPIFIAQHMAEGFTDGLVRWLASQTKLRVLTAAAGLMPRPGHVYFAPDRRDLEIDAEGIMCLPEPRPRGHTPSGDRLLESLAKTYGSRGGGIVLTGMGDDGAAGLLALRHAGGVTLAQSRESCVVFGMPQAAIERGAATDVLPLQGLVDAIRSTASMIKSESGGRA